MQYNEPHIEGRIEAAKKFAEKLLSGRVETNEEFEWYLRFLVSKHYQIPIHSQYFDDLTFDQLLLEVELIRGVSATPEQRASDIVKSNKDEVDHLFDGMEDPVFTPPSMDPAQNQFARDAMEFMETGEFKGEENGKE